jgi:hypothetical protein
VGLTDHPWVRRHLPEIAEGKVIVEALRDGTQLNTIEHFLNIDDLAILRPKPEALPVSEVREAVVRAFSHVGKRYDFGFDTNTWDTIVCSELAFQSYLNVPWTTRRVLRAHTISPDDVAVFAGADPSRPFSLVAFVHDGQLAHDSQTGRDDESLYVRLLGRRYRMPAR